MFLETYRIDEGNALRATSWGGPQIMGVDHRAAGFFGPAEMVTDMAESGDAHFDAFVQLVPGASRRPSAATIG